MDPTGKQKFLSAEQLGITEKLRSRLIDVLVLFESGTVIYDPTMRTAERGFNLSAIVQKHPNGVCGCIFGWSVIIDRIEVGEPVPKRSMEIMMRDFDMHGLDDLLDLYFGPVDRKWNLNDVTIEQAIEAIRNYMATGKARWETIIGNKVAA